MSDKDHIHSGALLFIVGPCSLYINTASKQEILDAYEQLGRYVSVAAEQLDARVPYPVHPGRTYPSDPHAGGRGPFQV